MDVLYNDFFASFLFLTVGVILLLLEVFIPSMGILSVLALICTGFGIWGLWQQDRAFLAILACGGYIAYAFLMVRFIFKRLSLNASLSSETSTSVDRRIESSLVGQRGVVVTTLRPSGIVTINGQKVDVVSTGAFIDSGAHVSVIEVSGNRVVVREVPAPPADVRTGEPTAVESPASPATTGQKETAPDGGVPS